MNTLDSAVNKVARHAVKFGTSKIHVKMLRAIGTSRNERQVDIGCHHAGQFNLGFFSRFTNPLHGHLITCQVNAVLFLEFIGHPIHDAMVEVIAAQMGITGRGFNFEDAITQFQNGNIEVPPPRS